MIGILRIITSKLMSKKKKKKDPEVNQVTPLNYAKEINVTVDPLPELTPEEREKLTIEMNQVDLDIIRNMHDRGKKAQLVKRKYELALKLGRMI